MTSPGRISATGSPQRCARPQPAVTIRAWPRGWVCHAVRAPGAKVTLGIRPRSFEFVDAGTIDALHASRGAVTGVVDREPCIPWPRKLWRPGEAARC